jgi:hypothetical protein
MRRTPPSALQSPDAEPIVARRGPGLDQAQHPQAALAAQRRHLRLPGCDMPLLLAMEDDPDDDIVIAKECHMIGQSDDAREVPPRSTPTSARAGPAWSATATRSPISSSCLAFTTTSSTPI